MSKDKGIALRPLEEWKGHDRSSFRAQARYRPNLQILPRVSLSVTCKALHLVGQSYRPTEHFQSIWKTLFRPAEAHRRKKLTVVFSNFVGRTRMKKVEMSSARNSAVTVLKQENIRHAYISTAALSLSNDFANILLNF